MIGPALVAGGASLLGGILGNRAQREESQRNRDFQERMSGSSWQRGVADMTAAGLNPALAYSKGGASSPAGSMAQQDDVIGGAVSSAMGAKRLAQELKVMKEQENAIYQKSRLDRQLTEESAFRRELIARQQEQATINNRLLELQIPWMQATARAATKFPEAAILKLITQSGGAGIIGSTIGAASYAGSRLSDRRKGGK